MKLSEKIIELRKANTCALVIREFPNGLEIIGE